jgi:hypothetical protein
VTLLVVVNSTKGWKDIIPKNDSIYGGLLLCENDVIAVGCSTHAAGMAWRKLLLFQTMTNEPVGIVDFNTPYHSF